MLAFRDITKELVSSHFEEFKTNCGDRPYNHLLLGKMVVWAEQFSTGGTLKKFIRREFGLELANHTYMCAKLFRAIHGGEIPGISEESYDALALNDVLRVSPMLEKASSTKIAEMLLGGVSGQSRFRRVSKDPRYPRAGYVYILVSSAQPMLTKIGRTQLDPYARAQTLSRQTGVSSAFVVVWYERVSDCVVVEGLIHQRFAPKRHPQGGDEWFAVTSKEAIPVLMELAKQYSLNSNGGACST